MPTSSSNLQTVPNTATTTTKSSKLISTFLSTQQQQPYSSRSKLYQQQQHQLQNNLLQFCNFQHPNPLTISSTSKPLLSKSKNLSTVGHHHYETNPDHERINSSDYSWCKLSGGFMTHWTTHYYSDDSLNDESRSRSGSGFHRPEWLFFQYFKLVILVRIVHVLVRHHIPGYQEYREHVYLGSFSKFMGGPLHFTELIAFFWSLSESMMYYFCVNTSKDKFTWIKVFLFLNQANIPGKLYYYYY